MPQPTPPPAPFLDFDKLTRGIIPELLHTMFVTYWWVWPFIIGFAFLRGRIDRMEERRKTERRIRDEEEIRARIEKERRGG